MEHINSASYISVLCSKEANPKFNRLQLRTDSPTFIELHQGWNILMVEDFPDLKFGFSQIDERIGVMSTCGEENCQEVLEFDFSHFDASEMTTMDYMFDWMQNIRKIEFGGMQTPKLTSADHAFSFGNSKSPIDMLDLSGLDFSKLIDASVMFRSACISVLNLSGCDFSHVEFGTDMFDDAEIHELILDNILLNKETLDSLLLYSDTIKLSLKGWKESDIKKVIQNLENYRNTFTIPNMEKPEYVLDSGLDYRLYENDKGETVCTIIKKHGNPSK